MFRAISVIDILTLALLAAPLPVDAQQLAKMARIGFLRAASPPDPYFEAFRKGLHDLGYVEGKTVTIEYRWTAGTYEPLRQQAAEIANLRVDVFVTSGTTATQAAKDATSTIPIVFGSASDPVQSGFIASLAKPGGNVTGLSTLAPDLDGKRLELLKEALPELSDVGILFTPDSRASVMQLKATQVAAKAMGLTLRDWGVRSPGDLDEAFAAATRSKAKALIATHTTFMFAHRKRIGELAAKHGLPVIFGEKEYLEAGGLMAYGVHQDELYRRAATYVDKILKGAKPADLPVEQPTKFELVINLKTAKSLGLAVPPSVLMRADEVIQ